MKPSTTHTIHTENADIVYDTEGHGPVLLLIAGGNGDGSQFTAASTLLAEHYTVVRYDRRANARSTGDIHAEMDMAQQARDAAAVIRAIGNKRAYVFGNSAGANIALKLTQDHPELVRGLIDHEPPITDILPDASKWRTFLDSVYDTHRTQGGVKAMVRFISTFIGLGPVESPEHCAELIKHFGGHERFLSHEFNVINHFVPDLAALNRSGVPIVTAVGRTSGNAFYAECARELARQLPCPCLEITGNHLAFSIEPVIFAQELHQIIRALPERKA